MWHKINKDYYLKFYVDQNNYKLFISNFVDIWFSYLLKDEFIRIVKQSNDQLETSESNLLNEVTNMLQEVEKAMCTCTVSNNIMQAKILKKSLEGYTVKLKLQLMLGSKQMFFQEVTLTLMNTIKDLKEGQEELFTVLKKKDKQIESYKLDGATLSLIHLKTPRFNPEEHLSKYSVFNKVFSTSHTPDDIILKKDKDGYIDPIIKQEAPIEPSIIKEEPSSQTYVNQENSRISIKNEINTPKKRPRKFLNL